MQREGKLVRTKHLIAQMRSVAASHVRVGLVVPRMGHTAVERNRIKRRLREAIRLDLLPGAPRVALVVRISKSAYDLSYTGLRSEVERLAQLLQDG